MRIRNRGNHEVTHRSTMTHRSTYPLGNLKDTQVNVPTGYNTQVDVPNVPINNDTQVNIPTG